MKNLSKIIKLLTYQERKQALYLLFMILFVAILDAVGVASIMPFIAVLTNPDIIETNALFNKTFIFSNILGIKTREQFLFALGSLVFLLLVFSLVFKATLTYFQLRFSSMCQYQLSKRMMSGYLNQPYDWFLNQHSADIGKTILSEVNIIISKGLIQLLNLITYGVIAFALLILLILSDPIFALIAGFSLAFTYLVVYKFTRKFLLRIGHERVKANQARFTVVSEAFNAAKELKVGNLEKAFIEKFSIPAKILAQNSAIAASISQLPRYVLEIIAFGGMLLLILYLMLQNNIFTDALPLIALYTFAGYRLIPALQRIYASVSQLRFVDPSINSIYDDFKSLDKKITENNESIISLKKEIILNELCYQYPNTSDATLKNINLRIPAHSFVGITGSTGSGKTTIIDIILGLLHAQKGTLKVDNEVINLSNCVSWQKSIGYVPQNIFIADDTIAANIAFGLEKESINHDQIQKAAKIANIHDFVINELPQKYSTIVGERGIRLSGGERQRIGIARALYRNPQVLILDEATSALDNLTESAVMTEIHKIGNKKTVILIAHRLTTLKECDIIFLLNNGKLEAQGTYNELIKSNDHFRANASKV
jgi:ABC-type multidrug transport system fused ATPase/permease subunit